MSRTSAREALSGGSRPLTRLCPSPRSGGPVLIKNPHLDSMEEDILYHLDLGTRTHNLPAMFGDIKVSGRGRSEAAAPRPAGSLPLVLQHCRPVPGPRCCGRSSWSRTWPPAKGLGGLFWTEGPTENSPLKYLPVGKT